MGEDNIWGKNILGKSVSVKVDRPIGSKHPEYEDIIYPLNYGYIEGISSPDGEEQDVYILGVDEPVNNFDGKIIAVISREDDNEEKWVAAPEGVVFDQAQIEEAVRFQEKYFNSSIISIYERSCGVILFRVKNAKPEYLLLLQSLSQTWSFPKGHAEAGETEEQTALRELKEETGIDAKLMDGFREELSYWIAGGRLKRVVLYLAEIDGGIIETSSEADNFIWADVNTARELLGNPDYHDILESAEKYIEKYLSE